MGGFIPIKKLKIQYTPPTPHPPRRRRRDLYISDFSDEEIKKNINVDKIDGDESVNIKKNVEKII
jgi:hypothetical protein